MMILRSWAQKHYWFYWLNTYVYRKSINAPNLKWHVGIRWIHALKWHFPRICHLKEWNTNDKTIRQEKRWPNNFTTNRKQDVRIPGNFMDLARSRISLSWELLKVRVTHTNTRWLRHLWEGTPTKRDFPWGFWPIKMRRLNSSTTVNFNQRCFPLIPCFTAEVKITDALPAAGCISRA